MSIVTVRNLIEKPGCYIPASIAMIAGIAGGLFAGSMGGGGQQGPSTDAGPVVASVGEYKVTGSTIEAVSAQQLQQLGGALNALTPELEARFLADTARQVVDQGYILELARRKKVDLSDSNLMASIARNFDEQMAGERARLEQAGTLKKGATDAEFVAELKKQQPGFDPAEEKKRQEDTVKQSLADPTRKPQIQAFVAARELEMSLAAANKPTAEELKAFFNTYTIKRITVSQQSAGSGTPLEVAEKALKEIQGGLAFEAAMERYSSETPAQGKKVGETTIAVTGREANANILYKGIDKLKSGEVSGALENEGSAYLYKLISLKNELPKDFETAKAGYERELGQMKANAALRAEIEALKKELPVKWESAGYEALVDWRKAADEGLSLAGDALKKRKEKLAEIRNRAKAAIETDLAGRRPAILAQFAAMSMIYNESNPDERKALSAERLEAITFLLEITESAQLRLEMVDLMVQQKDAAAGEELARVAEGNFDPTAPGQGIYSGVDAKLPILEKAKLVTEEQKKRIADAQASWRAAKKDHDAAEAEAKKMQAEEEAKMKAEEAKAKAEEEKNKAAPKPRSEKD